MLIAIKARTLTHLALSVFVVFFLNFSAVVSAEETLLVFGDDSAKPKNWIDENGQAQGIMIDLLSEVTKRTGINFTYELYPWRRALANSENGDGAIIGFSKTKEREIKWLYSDPMFFDELVFVTVKNKNFPFTGLDSLKGLRIAIKRGASYGDDFEKAKAAGIFQIVESTNRAGQMRMLTVDRADAVLMSPGRVALETVIAENEWLIEHKDQFVIIEPAYKSDPNFLGIPKSMNKDHLLQPINDALKAIKDEGLYQDIVSINTQKAIAK